MNSTEFIKECQENDYGTEIYIVDEDGNEYEVEEVGTIMFGQFHLYLKIKNYGPRPKIFSTVFLMVFLNGLWIRLG